MKKLDRLILKSFLGPLVLTFAIAVFVLLMQFVWKYIDDLVGKGLDFIVIAKLLFYASATFVPMALPISVLFASIMTMGNFGEKYELVAMKAGGVSLSRVMMPMAFVALLLTGMAFLFANNVMPVAMLQYRTILYDVTRKKPAINIRPSEYYTDLEGYVIRANEKASDGSTLRDIIIYDHTDPRKSNVIVARNGKMHSSADDSYLFFTLEDGCVYSESTADQDHDTRPLTRVEFSRQVMTFNISSFAFEESDTKFFEGSYQMMNVSQLRHSAADMEGNLRQRSQEYCGELLLNYAAFRPFAPPVEDSLPLVEDTLAPAQSVPRELDMMARHHHAPVPPMPTAIPLDTKPVRPYNTAQGLDGIAKGQCLRIVNGAAELSRTQRDKVETQRQIMQSQRVYLNRHYIEMHRKFTLSVACLLLFLVGASFGSIVRKGGLGLPLVASVVFFVLYYVVGMICEKAVREGALPPIGMWVSSFVMLPIGIVLTIQATTDRNLAIGQWLIKVREKVKKLKVES